MTIFNTLPFEIHCLLAEFLQTDDLYSLSQTCTFLKVVFGKFTWRKCVIIKPDLDPTKVSIELKKGRWGYDLPTIRRARIITFKMFCQPFKYSWFLNNEVRIIQADLTTSVNNLNSCGISDWDEHLEKWFKKVLQFKFSSLTWTTGLPEWFTKPRANFKQSEKEKRQTDHNNNKGIVFNIDNTYFSNMRGIEPFHNLSIPQTEYITSLCISGRIYDTIKFTAKLPNVKVISVESYVSFQIPVVLKGFQEGNFPKLEKMICSFSCGVDDANKSWISKSFIPFYQLLSKSREDGCDDNNTSQFLTSSIEFEMNFRIEVLTRGDNPLVDSISEEPIKIPEISSINFRPWDITYFDISMFDRYVTFPRLRCFEFDISTLISTNSKMDIFSNLSFLSFRFNEASIDYDDYNLSDILNTINTLRFQNFKFLKTFSVTIINSSAKLNFNLTKISKIVSLFTSIRKEIKNLNNDMSQYNKAIENVLKEEEIIEWIHELAKTTNMDPVLVENIILNLIIDPFYCAKTLSNQSLAFAKSECKALLSACMLQCIVKLVEEKMPNIEYLKLEGPLEMFYLPQLEHLILSSTQTPTSLDSTNEKSESEIKIGKKLRQIVTCHTIQYMPPLSIEKLAELYNFSGGWWYYVWSERCGYDDIIGKKIKIYWDLEKQRKKYPQELDEIEKTTLLTNPIYNFRSRDSKIREDDFDFQGWL